MTTSSSLFLPGPAGRLEACLNLPAAWDGGPVAVVCHPHSLYGGSLSNKVVYILAETFTALGLPTLRFNFRGVGKSEGSFDQGRGEQADLQAAVDWLRTRYPDAPLWLAGFSFGAYVAYQAHRAVGAARLLLVAPPVDLFDFGPPQPVSIPWLVIQPGDDEIVDVEAVRAWVAAQPNPPEFHLIEGASHFFHGRLNDLRALVRERWGPAAKNGEM